ncbi:MAG TPA: pyridoxal-dependent decarboxylase [Gemmatimonadaceae bacterium]|nr:pyridoxal-dependent decarboxylase [Gemmatimonadaceae bacterium]
MTPSSPLDLDRETMRQLGHRVADLVAEHLSSLREQPVQQFLPRPDARALIAGPPPRQGQPFEDIVTFLRERVFPYHAREPHPRFLGYVPGSPTFPAIAGDWIATGFNFFAGVWSVAAGPNELELTVLEWFREWLGMPEASGGLLTSGGSGATLTAVVAARHAALGDRADGLPRLTAYCSDQAHSAVVRGAWIAGITREHVRSIPTDDQYRMRMDALAEAIAADRARGLQPFLVVGSAGTTSTGAVDPMHALAELAAREQMWFHVDAAYGGFAALTDRGRGLLDGVGRADSIALDPHKWLFVPFECGCVLVRDPRALTAAFRIMPEYLSDVQARDQDVNFADRGEQLTRYARALKVWVMVQYFGLDAIREAIAHGMALAQLAESLVADAPELEVITPAQLGIVCFRVHPRGLDDEAALNALNERVNASVNATGRVLISSTRLRGTFALRICALSFRTTADDIRSVIALVRETARGLGATG